MIMMPYGRCRSSLQLTGTQTSDTPQVLVIISVTTDSKIPPAAAAVAIGSALAAAILISGPVSGAAVDPARALGPMILTGRFTDRWPTASSAPRHATMR